MSTDDSSRQRATRREAEQDADPRVDLAVERTELALERTQLAWVRTVFGLYTAGIALDKGLEALHQARILRGNNWVNTGHGGGVTLALLGAVLSTLTTVIFVRRARELSRIKRAHPTFILPAAWLSAIAALLGGLLLVLMVSPDW